MPFLSLFLNGCTLFTGIIEAVGTVEELRGGRLAIRAPLAAELRASDSVAVNGVCLTVVASASGALQFDLSPETLERTNLGALPPGSLVNLERPLLPASRLGGHFVQGHVDGTAELVACRQLDAQGNYWLEARVAAPLLRYVAWKGSVALDGISLTVASLEDDQLGVAVIPYTYGHTNLRTRRPGERLNLECDLIARYLERLLASPGATREPAEPLTVERLVEEGF